VVEGLGLPKKSNVLNVPYVVSSLSLVVQGFSLVVEGS